MVIADSVYDVIEDEANQIAELESNQRQIYEDLERSTRVFTSPQSQVYQQILPDAATHATDSNAVSQEEEKLYLQIIAGDYQMQTLAETTQSFHYKRHKFDAASTETAAKSNTIWEDALC